MQRIPLLKRVVEQLDFATLASTGFSRGEKVSLCLSELSSELTNSLVRRLILLAMILLKKGDLVTRHDNLIILLTSLVF